jgi:hypothetical protein
MDGVKWKPPILKFKIQPSLIGQEDLSRQSQLLRLLGVRPGSSATTVASWLAKREYRQDSPLEGTLRTARCRRRLASLSPAFFVNQRLPHGRKDQKDRAGIPRAVAEGA